MKRFHRDRCFLARYEMFSWNHMPPLGCVGWHLEKRVSRLEMKNMKAVLRIVFNLLHVPVFLGPNNHPEVGLGAHLPMRQRYQVHLVASSL